MIERVVAYEPQFDRIAYESLGRKDKERLDAYTRRQLETHLGERFNILLSQTRYEIKDGQIFGENTNEPFMQMLKRGVSYRKKFDNPVDFEREEAEVLGFEKIQENLTSGGAEVGTMMLSVSPPGEKDSIYRHNFYDVFTLKEDEKGKYVEAIRYSSSLTIEEYVEKLKPFKAYKKTPKDSDFLKNPIKINRGSFASSDEIHKYLHKEHDYITKEEFDEVIWFVSPLIASYINALSEDPFDENWQLLNYNALLNKSDIVLSNLKKAKIEFPKIPTKEEIYRLGRQPVRMVPTGCGASGGFTVSEITSGKSPFSVSEFGLRLPTDKYGSRSFNCPTCGKENIRPENKLLTRCQHCDSNKVSC